MEEIKEVLRRNRDNIPDIDIELDSIDLTGITTAEIDLYYSQIKDKWEHGVNTVNNKGDIIARSYTLLAFPSNEGSIEEIDLGSYDEEYGGRFFYRLLTSFEEETYTLSDLKEFREWQYEVNAVSMEQYFDNENPEIKEKEIDINLLTGGISPVSGIPNNYTLPKNSLTDKYIIEQQFDSGKALGIGFKCNTPFDLYIGNKEKDSEPIERQVTESVKYSPLLKDENFTICIKPLTNVPKVVIKAYVWGTKEKFKTYLYNGEIEEKEEILMHPIDEIKAIKLKPPGKANLPDNFWNMRDTSNIPIINNIFNRLNREYDFKN
jgi:hypothetical protein